MNNIDTPILRFHGFNDNWKQKKLGNITIIRGRIGFRGYTQKDIITKNAGGILTFSPTNIINNKLSLDVKNTYITLEKFKESPEIEVKNTQILFVKTGSTLGKSAFVINLFEKATINPQIVIISSKVNFISKVISIILVTAKVQKQIQSIKIGGAIPTLTETELKKISLYLSNSDTENKLLGYLFDKLDRTISKNQQKLTQLKELKKSLLQKMFADKDKPILRFNGFNDDWNQKLIKNIFEITRGQVLSKDKLSDKKTNKYIYPVYSSQTTNQGILGYYDQYLFIDSITWTTDGANAGNVNYRSGKFYSTNVNGVLLSKEGYSNLAIAEILNTVAFKWVSHVGNPKLMNNVMGSISIKIPESFAEQSKLSMLINKLNNSISLQDKKVEQLKDLKKGMLQKMFC